MAIEAWGIKPKNIGQQEALEALLNPEIELVVLEGIAGSGKTLLALAAGLEQVLNQRMYNDILFTRAPVPLGHDMGFLPGTEDEKLMPWCGALQDNMEVLLKNIKGDKLKREGTQMVLENYIKIKAMQFMRGRSFYRRYVIIDEVQNLTPAQIKVLISRAGEDTKIVIMGDINQIDDRKLTKEHNGLTSVIEKVGKTPFIKVIALPQGERSQLATWAGGVL